MVPQLDQLQKYRKYDVKTGEGEVKPENETLNSRYIRDFLRTEMGLETGRPSDEESVQKDLDHFDAHFNLPKAIQLANAKDKAIEHKQTKGEEAIVGMLNKAKSYLDQKGKPDLFEDMNPKSALSSLELLTKEKGDYTKRFLELKEAYFTYRTVRMYCRRIFEVEKVAAKSLEKQKTEIGGDMKEGIAEKINGLKENFGNLSGGEKLIAVGAAIFGTAMLLNSDSPRMERWKEHLFTAAKIGLFGYFVAPTAWKLFTGKSVSQSFNEWTSSTAGNKDFWKKSLRTNEENAEVVRASLIYLNEHNFLDMAERYKKAKASGSKKIELAAVNSKDLTPEQIYTALDVFFSQYGGGMNSLQNAENLRKRFRNHKPPVTWLEAVSIMLVEDGRLEFKGNLIERVTDEAGAYLTVGWNAAAGTAAGKATGVAAETVYSAAGTLATDVGHVTKELVGTTYGLAKRTVKAAYSVTKGGAEIAISGVEWPVAGVAWFGKWASDRTQAALGHKPTEKEIKEFREKRLFNILEPEPHVPHAHSYNLEDVIKDKMQEHVLSKEEADLYIKTLKDGKPQGNLKYLERPDAIFLAIDSPIGSAMTDPKKAGAQSVEPMREAANKAREFLKAQYKFTDEEVDQHGKIGFGIYEIDKGVYKLFMRMPMRGTQEFNKKIILDRTRAASDSVKKDVDKK